jgi:hypothetical protein
MPCLTSLTNSQSKILLSKYDIERLTTSYTFPWKENPHCESSLKEFILYYGIFTVEDAKEKIPWLVQDTEISKLFIMKILGSNPHTINDLIDKRVRNTRSEKTENNMSLAAWVAEKCLARYQTQGWFTRIESPCGSSSTVPATKEDLRNFSSNEYEMAAGTDKSERLTSFALTRKVSELDLLNIEIEGVSKTLYKLEANIRVLAELKNDRITAYNELNYLRAELEIDRQNLDTTKRALAVQQDLLSTTNDTYTRLQGEQ